MSKLHPEAITAYNARAQDVARSVLPSAPEPPKTIEPGGDTYVSREITDEHIVPGSTREYIRNRLTGQIVECRFHAGERGIVAVAGAAHDNLLALAETDGTRTRLP